MPCLVDADGTLLDTSRNAQVIVQEIEAIGPELHAIEHGFQSTIQGLEDIEATIENLEVPNWDDIQGIVTIIQDIKNGMYGRQHTVVEFHSSCTWFADT